MEDTLTDFLQTNSSMDMDFDFNLALDTAFELFEEGEQENKESSQNTSIDETHGKLIPIKEEEGNDELNNAIELAFDKSSNDNFNLNDNSITTTNSNNNNFLFNNDNKVTNIHANNTLLSFNESLELANFFDGLLQDKFELNEENSNNKATVMTENMDNLSLNEYYNNNNNNTTNTFQYQLPSPDFSRQNHKDDYKNVFESGYIPLPDNKIPEISIQETEIPNDILNDKNKVKKWKHLNLEKKRRNKINTLFKSLTSFIKYPRIDQKSQSTVRTPKHVLLNYILEDIYSLTNANKTLEQIINDTASTSSLNNSSLSFH